MLSCWFSKCLVPFVFLLYPYGKRKWCQTQQFENKGCSELHLISADKVVSDYRMNSAVCNVLCNRLECCCIADLRETVGSADFGGGTRTMTPDQMNVDALLQSRGYFNTGTQSEFESSERAVIRDSGERSIDFEGKFKVVNNEQFYSLHQPKVSLNFVLF